MVNCSKPRGVRGFRYLVNCSSGAKPDKLALLGTVLDGELAARFGRTEKAVQVMQLHCSIPTAKDPADANEIPLSTMKPGQSFRQNFLLSKGQIDDRCRQTRDTTSWPSQSSDIDGYTASPHPACSGGAVVHGGLAPGH
jgi:hypothetical protein